MKISLDELVPMERQISILSRDGLIKQPGPNEVRALMRAAALAMRDRCAELLDGYDAEYFSGVLREIEVDP